MNKKLTPCDCDEKYVIGVEYHGTDKHHYDGISEIQCTNCKKRWGRWSCVELKDDEIETVYGIGGPVKRGNK